MDGNDQTRYETMITSDDEPETTCHVNQNIRALLYMHHLRYTVPLISHYAGFFSLADSYFRCCRVDGKSLLLSDREMSQRMTQV